MGQDAETHQLQQEMHQTQEIIKDYGTMIAETDGISFYDVSRLPHPKDTIAKSLLLAIKLTTDERQRESLTVALGILARFQEGIGEGTISPSPRLPETEATAEQLVELFANHKPEAERFARLQEFAVAEEQAYNTMVQRLLSM